MSIKPRNSFTTDKNEIFTFEYDWTIKNFGFLDESIVSSEFSSGLKDLNDKWRLKLFPKLILDDEIEFVSIQLELLSCSDDKQEIITQYKISILSLNNELLNTHNSINPLGFSSNGSSTLIRRFIKRDDLFNIKHESSKYLPNDNLTIFCQIKILVDTKTMIDNNYSSSNNYNMNNHQKLINDLGQLLSSGLSSDFTFKVKGKSFQIIKGILAARSCIFQKMFEDHNDNNEYTVSDIEAPVFEELLRFIYTDEVPKIDQLPKELLAVADKYQLDELKIKCENKLIENINIDEAANLLVFADEYKAEKLKIKCLEFIRHKLRDVVATGPFQILKASHGRVFMAVLEAIAEIK